MVSIFEPDLRYNKKSNLFTYEYKRKSTETKVMEKSTWRINFVNLFLINKSNGIGKEK